MTTPRPSLPLDSDTSHLAQALRQLWAVEAAWEAAAPETPKWEELARATYAALTFAHEALREVEK